MEINKDNDDIFLKKIWRNIYIKKQILKCIHSYNSYKFNIEIDGSNFKELQEYQQCEFKESHGTVRIYFMGSSFRTDISVKESTEYIIELVESLSSFLTSSVHTLDLCNGLGRHIELPEGSIPSTIKCLTLDGFGIPKVSENIQKLVMGAPKSYESYCNLFPNKQCCLVHLDFSTITTFNEFQFELKSLPVTIEILKLPNLFNSLLGIGELPPGLVELYFGSSYNMEIKENILPSTLKVLEFGQRFNKPFGIHVLSSTNIQVLKFNRNYQFSQFNQELIPGSLPVTLKHLEFGDNFEHQIKSGTLSSTCLEVLIFGSSYNHPIDGGDIFPETLKRIVFGISFDQRITKNSFPGGLTSLKFVCAISKGFEDDWIPKSLIKLSLGNTTKIEQLSYNSMVIPDNVKKFTFYNSDQIIPPSIEYLSCRVFPSIKNVTTSQQLSVREIKFNNVYNVPLPNLNQYLPNIEILHVKSSKRAQFPIGLKSLRLGNGFFGHLKKEDLPQSLTLLELSSSSLQIVSNSWLPDNIKILIINGNNQIELPLPSSLHSIYLYCDYNYKKSGIYYNQNSQRIPSLLKNNPNLIGFIKPTTNKNLFKQLSRNNNKFY